MISPMRALSYVAAALALAVSLPAQAEVALPQALALVSTGGDVALRCDGAVCRAEFSAFCLERDKPSPSDGTAYHLVNDGGVSVAGILADGTRIDLPADQLSYRSMRRHLALLR